MSLYNATPTPPEAWEVPGKIKTLFVADSELVAAVGGTTVLHFPVDEWPASTPTVAAGEKWKRVLVRIPVVPGGLFQTMNRLLLVPAQVVVEIEDREGKPEPRQWCSRVHARIFYLLEGKTLSMAYADQHLPIERRHLPSAPAYDEQMQSYYSAAEYLVLLKPVD